MRNEIQYAWWVEIVRALYGSYLGWRYFRHVLMMDQYVEDVNDAAGMYCAGGEL
jgi:hypothetical protein